MTGFSSSLRFSTKFTEQFGLDFLSDCGGFEHGGRIIPISEGDDSDDVAESTLNITGIVVPFGCEYFGCDCDLAAFSAWSTLLVARGSWEMSSLLIGNTYAPSLPFPGLVN